MAEEQTTRGPGDFEDHLGRAVRWYEDNSILAPQIEAILAWGLSQLYQPRLSLPRLAIALDSFTAQEEFGHALLFTLAITANPLEDPRIARLFSPKSASWLSLLRTRYGARIAEWIHGDTKPKEISMMGYGHTKDGVVLDVRRADGNKLEFVIPFGEFLKHVVAIIEQFREGGGTGKTSKEEVDELKASVADLALGAGKAAGTGK